MHPPTDDSHACTDRSVHPHPLLLAVLVVLVVAGAFFFFETFCLWDGSAVGRCFDRPIVARLFGDDSEEGKPPPNGDTAATGATGASRRLSILTAAQLSLIMLGAFTLDVLFTAVATFLPGRASVRGISGGTLGLMFACYPVGQGIAALLAPAMLTHDWLDPVVGARKALLGAALVVAAAGVVDEYAVDPNSFVAGVSITRVIQGFVRATPHTTPHTLSPHIAHSALASAPTCPPTRHRMPLTLPSHARTPLDSGERHERGDGRRGRVHALRPQDGRLRRLGDDRRPTACVRPRADIGWPHV